MAPQIPDMPILITTKHHHGFQESSTITPQPHDFVAARIPKEIAVDPQSLNLKDHFHLNQQQQISSLKATNFPPPLRPPKSKFLSISQPNSAASSPRLVSKKKKPKGDHPQEINYLEKSKSCGEGRASAPSEELEDLWFANPRKSTTKDAIPNKINQSTNRIHKIEPPEIYINNHNNNNNNENKGFKCCLYLPGFGKAKPVRTIRKEESNSNHKMSTTEGGIAISRTVSLEKFECGSWAPSPRAVIQASDAAAATTEVDDSISSYFDLPSELIRCGGGGEDDAHSPVTAAFVFEKDIKGVLKNGSCRGNNGGRKSDASPRHVRFSTSSATSSPTSPASACITPRLRKAREEFNAFLEAQSA